MNGKPYQHLLTNVATRASTPLAGGAGSFCSSRGIRAIHFFTFGTALLSLRFSKSKERPAFVRRHQRPRMDYGFLPGCFAVKSRWRIAVAGVATHTSASDLVP
jgi:hypothetical protein